MRRCFSHSTYFSLGTDIFFRLDQQNIGEKIQNKAVFFPLFFSWASFQPVEMCSMSAPPLAYLGLGHADRHAGFWTGKYSWVPYTTMLQQQQKKKIKRHIWQRSLREHKLPPRNDWYEYLQVKSPTWAVAGVQVVDHGRVVDHLHVLRRGHHVTDTLPGSWTVQHTYLEGEMGIWHSDVTLFPPCSHTHAHSIQD